MSTTTAVNGKKISRNLIIVYIGIGISLISVIALIIVGIAMLAPKNYNNDDNDTTLTVTPSEIAMESPTPTPYPVNNKALLTMKIDAASDSEGTVWQISPTSLDREMLISSNTASNLLGWSPDNKYLALVTTKNKQNVYGFWDNANSNLMVSNIIYTSAASYFWADDTTFKILDYYSSSSPAIKTVSLPSMLVNQTAIATTVKMVKAALSPAADKIIYVESTDSASPIYLNLEAGTKTSFSTLSIDATKFTFGFWRDDNTYVYYTSAGIFSFDTSLKTATRLISLKSGETVPLNSRGMVLSYDKSAFYFVFESKLFKYKFASGVSTELYDLTNEVPEATTVEIAVTPNQKYVVLTYKSKAKILNVNTNTYQNMCDGLCNDIVSQN